jgi:uncharacterized membrane protein YgcG
MVRRLLGVLFCLLALAAPAWPEERIERFSSHVNVMTDASLVVVEEISVVAEGRQIKRGILRDFPTEYKRPDGSRARVGFEVLDVERNGETVDWRTENITNGTRLRIGSANRLLQPGIHTFKITYRTTRQIGFFDKYDELYWNVTGNEWTFPISEAISFITLPDGAAISKSAVFTGPFGSTSSSASLGKAQGNEFEATITKPLARGEGLTVAVAWQKGIVSAPTQAVNLHNWLIDNLSYGLLAATLTGVSIYYLLAWRRVGRDPPGGTIVPLFKPPEGLGPAGIRYIWKQKFDNQAFSAALVNLAVKGRVRIENNDDEFSVTRLADKGPALSTSEASLYRALPVNTLSLQNDNHRAVSTARDHLEGALEGEYGGTMFVKNLDWFAFGAAMSALGLIASGLLIPGEDGQVLLFAGIFSSIWWGVLLSVGYGAVSGLLSSNGFLSILGGVFRLLFLVPFVIGGIAVPALTIFQSGMNQSMVLFVLAAALLGIVNFVFLKLLPAPTPVGRKTLDQIEGFRMYLSTAEEKRLDVLNPPEKTPELFERYLPYAMALDCENDWNKKFTAVLAAATAAGATAPIWYGGTSSNWNSGGFARNLNNSLSSSVSAAASPPGSVSGTSGGVGGGGGGFSGGGGGGGGGSGW